mmetsp:Transcript_11036/g.15780  ORF Transcript_11036/g.15780 Transcript_11036/m.15780 type:complete len:153 (+) Transcript_11036:91-549(+)
MTMFVSSVLHLCLLVGFSFKVNHSFTLPSPLILRSNRDGTLSQLTLALSEQSFTDEEVAEMDNLIVDLSLDSDDDSRRSKVRILFEEQLQKPDGTPKRFTDLFDSVLINVGGRIQKETRNKAKSTDLDQNEDTVEGMRNNTEGKTIDELQLW